MELVGLPAAGVAQFAVGVVEHAVALELVVPIELPFVLGSVGEEVLSVGLAAEVLEGKVIDGLLGRVYCLDLADRSTLRLRLVKHIYWRLEFPQLQFARKTAPVVEPEGTSRSLTNLICNTALLHDEALDWFIHNFVFHQAALTIHSLFSFAGLIRHLSL